MALRLLTITAAAAGLLAACADVPGSGDVRWGQRIAEANCRRCHAIGLSGNSPNAFAPPLRELRKHYSAAMLNATFKLHTLAGHAPMPNFAMRADDLGDLEAYVRSIQEPDAPAWPKPPSARCGVGPNC